MAIENAQLKLFKVLSFNNNALYDSSKFFLLFLHLTLPSETWGLWIFSGQCDVILRFRWTSFNLPIGFMRISR